MFCEVNGDDLEKEITFMQQELIVKRMLLDECRQKLNNEMSAAAETKANAVRCLNENKELRLELQINLTALQKLEEEYNKNRDLTIKLQVQVDAYLKEREQVLERCYLAEDENNSLKNEISELKEELRGYTDFQEHYKVRQSKSESLINEIIKKQASLSKEQMRLEATCKEGFEFAQKLSQEATSRDKFIEEARNDQLKLENEMIRLMAVIREMEAEKKKDAQSVSNEGNSYLEQWKTSQRDMKIRNDELQKENSRLVEEVTFLMGQVDILKRVPKGGNVGE